MSSLYPLSSRNLSTLVMFLIAIINFTELFSQNDPDFYFYPTPSELFEVIDKEELTFNSSLINSIDNEPSYVLSTTRQLNLGVYISDLAYCAFFLKQAKSFDYLNTIFSLSDELLISSELKEQFKKRILSNSNNMDSIYTITNMYYYDVMMELEKNNSKSTIYLITTGAFVEAYYIALNLIEEYTPNNTLLREIAEQKASILNLFKFSKLSDGETRFPEVIKYQEELIEIFNKFLVEEGTKRTFTRTANGNIKFIGGPKITMNEEQYKELKSTVNRIRYEITQ